MFAFTQTCLLTPCRPFWASGVRLRRGVILVKLYAIELFRMSARDQMSKMLDQLMGQNRDGKL